MHTFIFRSSDRTYGETNDFRIKMPYLGELANSETWCVRVERVIFPRNDGYSVWYLSDALASPNTNKVFADDYVEVHLDFASASRSYDTKIKGKRIVHFVTASTVTGQQIMSSGPFDAVKYEVAKPHLNELHVRVMNKRNKPAGVVEVSDFPNPYNAATDLSTAHETAIPEWVFVLTIEPIEKYDS